MPERGDKVNRWDEGTRRLRHDDEDATACAGDLGGAAGAGQARRRMLILANDRRVDIAETVDLRAAEKTHRDAAALQPVGEHLRDRDGCERRLTEFRVADG